MAVEHADTGAEAVERPPAVEAPPPPPPDRPGAEDFPSRAESRAAASAAFDQSRRSDDTTEAGSDTSAAEAAEEQDASHGDRTESSPAPERDEPDARESAAWDSPAGTDHDPVDEGEQQPHSEKAFHSETATDELAPVDTDAQPESLDHRTPPSSEEVDARDRPIAVDAPAETADDQRPDDLAPPVDLPGAEPETLPSEAEGSARTAAVVEAETDQVSDTADVEVPVPAPEIGQQAQPSGDSPAGRLGDTSDRPGSGEALNAGESGIAESMEPAEGQAAITQVRSDDAADGTDLVDPSDGLSQVAEADEAAGLDGPEQESSGDGGGLPGERDTEVASAAEEERVPIFEWPTDDGKWARAYLDLPDEEANELDKPGSPPDPPTGEELLAVEDTETRKLDKFRRKLVEASGDVLDGVRQDADTIDKILKPRPPTSYPETATAPDHPVMAPVAHDGASAGDLATGLFVGGLVLGEGIVWLHDKIATARGRRS